ncbi:MULTISPECIES: alpha/beta hydrolase family protein [unclassified Pseudonocardia]|uniref:alpha/beta hydrolase n=1 Tax=unclassified Pseudonocardia TaxID=2619320 RepID=UPI001CF70B88|nr:MULTISPECIES: alpha/beta hydrolase-fold protein [unclassified Pseudonocardia]
MTVTPLPPPPVPATTPLDLSLVAGTLPLVISVAGVLAAAFLLWPRGPRWWRPALLAVVVAAALPALAAFVLNDLWRPIPDQLPARLFVWSGVALAALLGGVLVLRRGGRAARLLVVPAVLLVLATSGVKVNAIYGYYPTPRQLLGLPEANALDPARIPPRAGGAVTAARWVPPADLPAHGGVARMAIPGTVSRFPARPGVVYLPPAALVRGGPRLPVLVLVAGAPGGPADWLTAGRLAAVLDEFAAAHRGLAPVVVVPDATGGTFDNPLCMDSRRGAAETYLRRDVPDWIRRTFDVDPDPRSWTIGGFSYGGTCALQLAVRAPEVYPAFLDVGGQDQPSLGTREETVGALFGGDDAAFRAADPQELLRTRRYDGVSGTVVVGADEGGDVERARRLAELARTSGMDVRYLVLPGGHSWAVATAALQLALPGVAARGGLVPGPPR